MLFSGQISEMKLVLNVLKALPPNEFAIFRPQDEGLKITIENSKCSEISIYIPCDFFTAFEKDANADVMFKVHLKTFIETLQIFGEDSDPSVKMSYRSIGEPFEVIIFHTEENITIDCEFATLSVADFQDVYLLDECNVNSMIFLGEAFIDLLNDLDSITDEYDLMISNDPPNFRLSANSAMGGTMLYLCRTSPILLAFNCKEEFSGKYNFSNLRHILKVMELASKISLSTGSSGLLGLNLVIEALDKQIFVEYYFTAQFEEQSK